MKFRNGRLLCLAIWSRLAAGDGKIVKTKRSVPMLQPNCSFTNIAYKVETRTQTFDNPNICKNKLRQEKKHCVICTANWDLRLFPVSISSFSGGYLVTVMEKVCSTNPIVFNIVKRETEAILQTLQEALDFYIVNINFREKWSGE